VTNVILDGVIALYSLDLEQWINEPPSESEGEKFDDIDFLMEDEKKR